MAELSNSYIKGFVETCFKAGMHEKQAAALLRAVEEHDAVMEKKAWSPSFSRGVMRILQGFGDVGGATARGAWNAVSGGSKVTAPFKWYGRNVVLDPAKKIKDSAGFWPAALHVGATGVLPAGAATALFQNWRDSSDSGIASAINDVLGKPEFLVLGRNNNSTYIPSYNTSVPESNAITIGGNDSPTNIPGTTSYNPSLSAGENALLGGAVGTSSVPDELKPAFEAARDARAALKNLDSKSSDSVSASVRRNMGRGSNYERELRERSRQADNTLRDLITDINKRRTINNTALANEQASRAENLRKLRNQDAIQGHLAFDSDAPGFKGWLSGVANGAMEGIHLLDNSERARARESELINAQKAVDDINKHTPEGMLRESEIFKKLEDK